MNHTIRIEIFDRESASFTGSLPCHPYLCEALGVDMNITDVRLHVPYVRPTWRILEALSRGRGWHGSYRETIEEIEQRCCCLNFFNLEMQQDLEELAYAICAEH